MNHFKEKLIRDIAIRGMAAPTQNQYVRAVEGLSDFYQRDPDLLTDDEVQKYVYSLIKKDYSWGYINSIVSGLRFFFGKTLKRDLRKFTIPCPKKRKKLPEVLSRKEVRRVLDAIPTVQQEAYFKILYGAGLRASEGARLKLSDIDSSNDVLWVRQGKGGKDRGVFLSPIVLDALRRYYRVFPFKTWIFPGVKHPDQPMSKDRAWSWFQAIKKKAGITKKGGPHLLRHSYATHTLENGHDLYTLKKALGHSKLTTTMIYIHLARRPGEDNDSPLDHLHDRDD